MSSSDLKEWAAYYLITDSAGNSEVTQWDSKETAKQKLQAEATRKLRR